MTKEVADTREHVRVANVMLTVFHMMLAQRMGVADHANALVACYT